MKMTADHHNTFMDQGYVVVEDFYPEEKRAAIAAALRKQLLPYEELDEDPPGSILTAEFPYGEQFFNQLTFDEDIVDFARRILYTDEVHFRYAHNWARYPNPVDTSLQLHVDNGNNSLLPPCDDVRYGQMSTWYFPEAVGEDQAPMLVIPKEHGDDLSKGIHLAVSANTQMVFNTFLWHTATAYTASSGQRYSVTRIYGRADHFWEGVRSYTNMASRPAFRAFIGSISAKERELYRFPPAGHAYYTEATLAVLEEQYPGWNAGGEYGADNDGD